MIDENKLKMLTKIAKFEHESRRSGRELESMNRFKYIATGIFWTVITTSAAFFAAVLLIVYINGTFNENVTKFLNGNFEAFIHPFIWIPYVIFEGCFIVVAFAFYYFKYNKFEKKLEEYLRRKSTYNDYYNRRNQ